jgi:plasmid stabilization system protein ParE
MKSYSLVIEPEARDDIKTAIDYYNSIYGNLALKFIDAIESTLNQIIKDPFYQIKYDDVRSLQVKRFPYSIHYLIDEIYDEIKILAVIHSASNPDKIWMWREEE